MRPQEACNRSDRRKNRGVFTPLFLLAGFFQLRQAFEANVLAPKGQDMLLAFTEDTPILMLAQDHGIPIHINLQGILFCDVQCAPQLCGQDDSAKLVPLCQVGAKKFYKLSEKPLISMTLGFPDGATMHLRGFDRLCYFRSKFDRFAPK